MIAGLEEITKGELYIGDRLVNDIAPKDRDIAMVFQNYALYPHMTANKNMAFGLKLRKFPKDEIKAKVEGAANILDIFHLLDRKPKQLSGGQRQRVALGRAMVRDPAVFLLDEPLSNLDAKLRNTMRSEIAKLHRRLGTTFVYVTHDQIEAMTMGERIVVMNEGLIQQVDTPQNLYKYPCNLFVAGFIGTPPMNFMKGVIQKQGNRYAVKSCNTLLPIPSNRIAPGIISEYDNKEVIIGIRPEDLHLENEFKKHGEFVVVNAKLDLSEMMGSEIYLYLICAGNNLIGKIPANYQPEDNTDIAIALDCNNILIFDEDTKESLVKKR
jgi:multiple sugar transport system ATP-binding protein